MFSAVELLVLAFGTWALVAYCLRDLARQPASRQKTTLIVLLAVGVVVWPLAWGAAVRYFIERRRRTATAG